MTRLSSALRFIFCIGLLYLPENGIAEDSAGTVLITGANRGIGLALAERFEKAGYHVIGTARKPDRADELQSLGAQVEQLDVTDPDSVASLAGRLEGTAIDMLINNAGIKGEDARNLEELDFGNMATVLDVNTMGPMRVAQALFKNVSAGERKIVANVSSMMGSMKLNTWGCCLSYRASKAALNSLTKTLAVDYGERGITFVTLHPGYVQTDMNDGQGNITPAQSADGLFRVISELQASDNGRFYAYDGKELPW